MEVFGREDDGSRGSNVGRCTFQHPSQARMLDCPNTGVRDNGMQEDECPEIPEYQNTGRGIREVRIYVYRITRAFFGEKYV